MKQILLSTVMAFILLFICSGLSQFLPWGVPTAQKISAQTNTISDNAPPDLVKVPEKSLTTPQFDEQFTGKVSTYQTNETFSWIVTQPLRTDYTSYFISEAVTQFIVALLLSVILYLSCGLTLITRLSIVCLFGLCTSVATYGQLMNWWGLPVGYTLGVSANLIVSWLLVSFVIAQFILKRKQGVPRSSLFEF